MRKEEATSARHTDGNCRSATRGGQGNCISEAAEGGRYNSNNDNDDDEDAREQKRTFDHIPKQNIDNSSHQY